MSAIDNISDNYIKGIIKDNQPIIPDSTRTSGRGLQQLIINLREAIKAEFGRMSDWKRPTSLSASIVNEEVPLSYKGDFVDDENKAIIYILGQFHLGGLAVPQITLGNIEAGYRPSKQVIQRTSFGSADVFIVLEINGDLKLRTADGSALAHSITEPYSVNLFYRPAIQSQDPDRLAIRSIMLTAFDEYGFDTEIQRSTTTYGGGKTFNGVYEQVRLRRDPVKTDFLWMLDEDLYLLPDLEEAVMWINWFSPSMFNPQYAQPFIQHTVKESIAPEAWNAGGYNAAQAVVIPQLLRGSGSMNDMSFVRGAKALQARGIRPGIVPVISTLDINGTPADYLNWRGYVFFDNLPDFRSWLGSYEIFIKYYVDLCVANEIALGTIYVGSEYQCLTTMNYEESPAYQAMPTPPDIDSATRLTIRDEFINKLGDLAAYCRVKFPDATITYAANWMEYNTLDSLWAKPGIDTIGVDWYFPVSEQHTNDPAALSSGVFSGEFAEYTYTNLNPANYKLSTTDGQGKANAQRVPIAFPDYQTALKFVREYRAHLQSIGIEKPFMATELGVASCNGSAVLPNVFPVLDAHFDGDDTGNVANSLPDSHNMKPLLLALAEYNYQVKDIYGPYGSTFEMDEEHQFVALKAISGVLADAGITRQVIYTADARYSGLFGATIYNTETEQDEVYTSDTAVYPLSHTINGKKAGGYMAGDLIERIMPHPAIGKQLPESTASLSIGSFVNTDLYDEEWKMQAPFLGGDAYTLIDDDEEELNPGKNATGRAGRFAYFTTLGSREPLEMVNGLVNFEAKGDGKIEIVIFSASDMSIQARRTFTLTDNFRIYAWELSPLYPQLECIIGVFLHGMNADDQVTAVFKKNFAVILEQADLSGNFYRYRADTTNLMGNVETAWYGVNDQETDPAHVARKKYLQSSAYSKFKFTTDAEQVAIEYVRDFYNNYSRNLLPYTELQNGTVLTGSGTLTSGAGAVNTYTKMQAGKTYTISGLYTTQPQYAWWDLDGNPVSGRMDLVNNKGTAQEPVYQITAPAGAARLALLIQRIVNTSNPKDPANDRFTVYSTAQVEEGAAGESVYVAEFGDETRKENVPTTRKTYIGAVPSRISGLSIFVTLNGTTTPTYLPLEESGAIAKRVTLVTAVLPPGMKTVEIVHNGRGTYLPESPQVRRAGTYMRAVYFPELSVNTLITQAVNPVVFVGDSIISGFNISSNSPQNVWIQKIARDNSFGYQGDVFAEAYAGRILHTDTGLPGGPDAFAAKLAAFKKGEVTPKFWFQIGVNDYGFATPISMFRSEYPAVIDKLNELLPDAKIYIQTIGPEFYEGANFESHQQDDPDIPTGPTAEDFRDVQRDYADSRVFTELVEFAGLFPATVNNVPDGIHPNDAGNLLYAQGIKDKSNLIITHAPDVRVRETELTPFITTQAYSFSFRPTGGQFPYTFTVTAGQLPAGIQLDSDGKLHGTPQTTGAFDFTMQVMDANGISKSYHFSGLVTNTQTGIPESDANLGLGSFINTDIYSEEWRSNTPQSFSNVTDSGGVINQDHNAAGNAGRFAFFRVADNTGGGSTVNVNGRVSFDAKGTGTLEVVVFSAYQDQVQYRQAFQLETEFKAFSLDVSLYPGIEYYCGVFFSGMNTSGTVTATFKKNFSVKLQQYGFTGNFKRLGVNVETLTGNVESAWYGRNFDNTKKAVKYLQASSYSFLRFQTDASKLVVEYVRDSVGQGFTVFYTISGVTQYQYIDVSADYPAHADTVINQITVNLAAGSKVVEVVMPGHNVFPGIPPKDRVAGVFLRAVYLPETSSATIRTTVHDDSVCFVADSLVQGYPNVANPQREAWMNMVHRLPEFGYPGDIFTESYFGRYLYADIKDNTLMNLFVAKLAMYPVKKYWIQLGLFDYFTVGGPKEPGVTIDMYKTRYGLFLDALKVAKTQAKIFIQTIGPIANETANGYAGKNVPDYRQAVASLVTGRAGFVELVDFGGLFNGADTSYLQDGINPAGLGQLRYAEGIRDRSTLLTSTILDFTPVQIGEIIAGKQFSLQFQATGGTGTKTFSKTGDQPSLTITPQGLLSGVPQGLGAGSITVSVTDDASGTKSRNIAIDVRPLNILITPTENALNKITRKAFTIGFDAAGGTAPYTFSLTPTGQLPGTLSFDPVTHQLSGNVADSRTLQFSIGVTDAYANTTSKSYTLAITQPTITPYNAPTQFTIGASASGNMMATGGEAPYTYDIASGVLDHGISMSAAGVFSGTVSGTPGNSTVQVRAADANGNTGVSSFTFQFQAGGPALLSAETNYAGDQVSLLFNQAMADPAGQKDYFTVTQNNGSTVAVGVTGIGRHPSNTSIIQLYLQDAIQNAASVVKVSYSGSGSIQSGTGNALSAFSQQPVTNRSGDAALLSKRIKVNFSTTSNPANLTDWNDLNLNVQKGTGDGDNHVMAVKDESGNTTGYNATILNKNPYSFIQNIQDLGTNTVGKLSTSDPLNALFPVKVRATNAQVADINAQKLVFALLKADATKIYNVIVTGWQYDNASYHGTISVTGNNGMVKSYDSGDNIASSAKVTNIRPALITLQATSSNAEADGYNAYKITVTCALAGPEKGSISGLIIEECIDN